MATSVMVGGLRCSSCLASQWLHSISFTFALGANRPAQEQRQRMEAGTRDNESHFQGHSPYYLFRPSVPSIQVTLAVVEGSPLRGGYKGQVQLWDILVVLPEEGNRSHHGNRKRFAADGVWSPASSYTPSADAAPSSAPPGLQTSSCHSVEPSGRR